jgi:hypothetical protein
MLKKISCLLFAALLLLSSPLLFGQCMIYPVSLEKRVQSSSIIVKATVTEQVCFTQPETGFIYTKNILNPTAWLKGTPDGAKMAVLTLGGVDGDRAMITEPSLQLQVGKEYVLLLEKSSLTRSEKSVTEYFPFAETQGALIQDNFIYHDALSEKPMTEELLFQKIEAFTKTKAITADGSLFIPREPLIKQEAITTVSGFSPSTTNSGTIVPDEFLTITGVNFEAARGTGFVAFRNADDGGASYITPPVASDYVSWSASSITVKVPRNAGTGDFFVRTNGGVDFFSPSNFTVNYAHLSINNTFLNFASSTRQRYYLRNLNGSGGYTLTYNTTFNSDAQAKSSFQRALATWRCATGLNIRVGTTTSSISAAAADGVNIVSYDATLPAGVLARATSYFSGSGIGGVCDLANTVWWTTEMDIVFNNPPAAGFTWEYGPAAPSLSEFDFESVAVHELGHLHGMGHIIAPGLVMHYAISNGSSVRTLAARDIAAGNDKMSYSTTATCFNPAGSGLPMTAVPGGICSTLPVTLSVFEGKRVSSTSTFLNWKTEQEFNNEGFFMERSDDGLRFESIQFIKAKGELTAQTSYSFTDEKAGPFKRFYRLAQKDADGKINRSSIVAINGDNSTRWKIWINNSTLFLYNSQPLQQPATLQLFNSNGQLVFTKQITSSSQSIPVSLPNRNIYTYRFITSETVVTGKLYSLF